MDGHGGHEGHGHEGHEGHEGHDQKERQHGREQGLKKDNLSNLTLDTGFPSFSKDTFH